MEGFAYPAYPAGPKNQRGWVRAVEPFQIAEARVGARIFVQTDSDPNNKELKSTASNLSTSQKLQVDLSNREQVTDTQFDILVQFIEVSHDSESLPLIEEAKELRGWPYPGWIAGGSVTKTGWLRCVEDLGINSGSAEANIYVVAENPPNGASGTNLTGGVKVDLTAPGQVTRDQLKIIDVYVKRFASGDEPLCQLVEMAVASREAKSYSYAAGVEPADDKDGWNLACQSAGYCMNSLPYAANVKDGRRGGDNGKNQVLSACVHKTCRANQGAASRSVWGQIKGDKLEVVALAQHIGQTNKEYEKITGIEGVPNSWFFP